MSHRTQITLSDEQYRALQREARRTGASLAELVRRAVVATYRITVSTADDPHRRRTFERSFGLWRDRDFDGEEYVERLRQPGLGHRVAR